MGRRGQLIWDVPAIESFECGPRRLCSCSLDVRDDEPITGTALLDPIEPLTLTYLRQVLLIG